MAEPVEGHPFWQAMSGLLSVLPLEHKIVGEGFLPAPDAGTAEVVAAWTDLGLVLCPSQ
jgi:hypothetical protein